MTLNKERTEATVGGFTFKVGDTIDYKPSDSDKIGMGKITELKHPGYQQSDKESIWMCVADVVEGFGEWISCSLWVEHKKMGLFEILKAAPTNENSNQNTQPADIQEDDLW